MIFIPCMNCGEWALFLNYEGDDTAECGWCGQECRVVDPELYP